MIQSGQDIARTKRGMTPIRVNLTAGVPQRRTIEGDWIACITAAATDLTARFDQSEPVPLPAGLGFRRYYGEVEFESATGGAFVILAGFGSVADARAVVTANLTVNTEPGNTVSDGGDVSCAANAVTLLSALDATRLVLTVVNPSTNTKTMRIGTAAVAAATGAILEPGETITLATTAAVYAFNPAGAVESLGVSAVQQV